MSLRHITDKRATWRDRFLEIARQAERPGSSGALPALPGLRSRARMAGFALVRRARSGSIRAA